MYRAHSLWSVPGFGASPTWMLTPGPSAVLLAGSMITAAAQSIYDQVSPLVWVLLALSAGGAAITYAFLVYAIWRFRDPNTRRRNYG
jgi:hypothetical protein